MTRTKKLLLSQIAALFAIVPMMVIAHVSGADPGKTGAPNEQNCTECHAGTATRGRGVEIQFPGGQTYSPGQKQRLTIRVTGAQTPVYGFSISARVVSSGNQAGSFASVDGATQVICQDGRVKPAGGSCSAQFPREYPTHTSPRADGTFTVEWTPPDSNAGEVRFYAAGNAANGNGSNSGDQIFLNEFTATFQAGTPPPSIRAADPVLQAFTGKAGLSAGTWIEIYGTNLSPTTRQWAGSDFQGNRAPTSLDGVSVNVNGKPAFVSYISPTQVNVQAPDDDAVGPVPVEVVNAGGRSSTTVNKTKVSPALLTTPLFNIGGKQYAAALHKDLRTFVGRPNMIQGVAFRQARPGDTIILYAVGCGPTNPPTPAGQVSSDVRQLALPTQVRFGNTVAQAMGFLEPPYVGLCRFNITVPNVAGDANGDIALEVSVDGVASGQNLFTVVQP